MYKKSYILIFNGEPIRDADGNIIVINNFELNITHEATAIFELITEPINLN